MTIQYLSATQVAKRLGLSTGTIQSYVHKGLLPDPDALIGEPHRAVRGWLPETIDEWNKQRPGRGYRSDLLPKKH